MTEFCAWSGRNVFSVALMSALIEALGRTATDAEIRVVSPAVRKCPWRALTSSSFRDGPQDQARNL
jgi:hypothetical protein